MQALDFVYLLLNEMIQGNALLKNNVKLMFAYDKKIVNVRNESIVYVYDVSAVQNFYGIGGEHTIEEFISSVTIRTRDRRILGIFEMELYTKYPAKHYSFWKGDAEPKVLQRGVDYMLRNQLSTYIDKLTLVDGLSLSAGEIVSVPESKYEYGFVWNVYGNEAYIFYGEGEYMLTIVERRTNYSEHEKGFYMVSFDLAGKIIRPIRNI